MGTGKKVNPGEEYDGKENLHGGIEAERTPAACHEEQHLQDFRDQGYQCQKRSSGHEADGHLDG